MLPRSLVRMVMRSAAPVGASFTIVLFAGCATTEPVVVSPNATVATPAARPPLEPFTETIDGSTVTIEMVPVPGGMVTVDLGAGATDVRVAPFWVGRTEITWDAYDQFVFGLDDTGAEPGAEPGASTDGADAITRPSRPYINMDRGYGHDGYPAISMSPKAATDFCHWLSAKTGRTYRLPTEAEWQFLCVRSGIDRAAIDEFAWHRRNSKYQTHRVATKAADALGLHDLYGNAMEWCVGPDGVPMARGGSFLQSEDEVGCGFRAPLNPDWNASDPQIPKSVWWLADGGFVGFRVVCVPPPTTGEPPKGATP